MTLPLLLWAESPLHSMHDLHAACLNDIREGLAFVCNSKMLHPPSKSCAGSLLLCGLRPQTEMGSLRWCVPLIL